MGSIFGGGDKPSRPQGRRPNLKSVDFPSIIAEPEPRLDPVPVRRSGSQSKRSAKVQRAGERSRRLNQRKGRSSTVLTTRDDEQNATGKKRNRPGRSDGIGGV